MATIKWYNPDTDEWEYVGVGSSGGGSGDVVGPSSATDNSLARFDGSTGKLLQGSGIVVGDPTDIDDRIVIGSPGPLYFDNVLRIAGDPVVSTSNSVVLTSKRINPRVTSTTSASSLTPNILSADQYNYTALAANLTINAPTGTPVDGNKLLFRIKDNGTSRTLTWNSAFRVVGVTLPTATTVSKTHYIGCVYNAADTKWDVIAAVIEA